MSTRPGGRAGGARANGDAGSVPGEVRAIHTRILRTTLAIEESRAYWAHVDPAVPPAARAALAFEQRWFGAKSLERVRTLLANFVVRYDAYPASLAVLRRWGSMAPATRRVICHVHLQLADPLYRRFTGEFLVERRERESFDRPSVVRWVREQDPAAAEGQPGWAAATAIQFASKLLSAAAEAGLVAGRKDPRRSVVPVVADDALGYVLQLLRGTRIEASLLANPYLASLGLTGVALDQRLRSLPGLTYHRMGHLDELHWEQLDLPAWAAANL